MNEMAAVVNSEREPSDIEALPEYVREGKAKGVRSRDSLEFVSSRSAADGAVLPLQPNEPEGPQTDVLEALWPGVHQDFATPVRRSPSFYLMIGFMGGAFASLVGVWLFSVVSPLVSSVGKPSANAVVVQKDKPTSQAQGQSGASETLTPAVSVYQVQSGDTLAGIALKNYKHLSPRLLDEICRANDMKNANVLSLGQKITLPVYRPQTGQPAASATVQGQ
jgi:LysM repeat protein